MLRRSFLSRFATSAAVLGFTQEPAVRPAARWQAATHPQDEWFDQVPGRHRVCFDTFMTDKFSEAVAFVGNYLRVNRDVYGLEDRDVAVVLVVRHKTAPFAFADGMWAKYGRMFSERMAFVDPKTHEAPTTNVYGAQIAKLVSQGVHLAVCNLTTRAYSKIIADATHADEEAIYKELTGHTLGNSHFVPAGVVAVTRAQEHGYVLVSVG